MAKVFRVLNGYMFVGLRRIGMKMVNEFQRHHPLLCKPTEQPDVRFIRLGSEEQNRQLGKLISEIRIHDPEPKPESMTFKRRTTVR